MTFAVITILLWTLAAFKIGVWFVVFMVIWLTLWTRHKEYIHETDYEREAKNTAL
jgi:hypothetical protein